MSDSPFMPGWAWGVTAALVVGGAVLLALPGGVRPKGYRGLYDRRQFWPNVDKARKLVELAKNDLARGDRTGARMKLTKARSALSVASFYAGGPDNEQTLRERYKLVSEMEEVVA